VNTTYHIYPCGDNAITISFGDEVDVYINDRVQQFSHYLKSIHQPYWLDIIPAYTTVTLVYNSIAMDAKVASPFNWMKAQLQKALDTYDFNRPIKKRSIQIPVCYDPIFAPDTKYIAVANKLTIQQIIDLHCHQSYQVFMLGFLPGFAYMGPVDDRIAAARLDKPRAQVPSGSVGIAGKQTGIYPIDSPGGWNIIGRTPVKLFNPECKDAGVLLQPGDEVSFISITKKEFDTFDQATLKIQMV
jgi:inhibitor of KinA